MPSVCTSPCAASRSALSALERLRIARGLAARIASSSARPCAAAASACLARALAARRSRFEQRRLRVARSGAASASARVRSSSSCESSFCDVLLLLRASPSAALPIAASALAPRAAAWRAWRAAGPCASSKQRFAQLGERVAAPASSVRLRCADSESSSPSSTRLRSMTRNQYSGARDTARRRRAVRRRSRDHARLRSSRGASPPAAAARARARPRAGGRAAGCGVRGAAALGPELERGGAPPRRRTTAFNGSSSSIMPRPYEAMDGGIASAAAPAWARPARRCGCGTRPAVGRGAASVAACLGRAGCVPSARPSRRERAAQRAAPARAGPQGRAVSSARPAPGDGPASRSTMPYPEIGSARDDLRSDAPRAAAPAWRAHF